VHHDSLAKSDFVAQIRLWPVSSICGPLDLETARNLTPDPGGLSHAAQAVLKIQACQMELNPVLVKPLRITA
jgi:hypothetical protein